MKRKKESSSVETDRSRQREASMKTEDRPPSTPIRTPWTRRRTLLTTTGVVGLILAVLSFRVTGISIPRFLQGLEDMGNLFNRMIPPLFIDLPRSIALVLETFMIAVAGTAMAVVISIPVAYLAASNTTRGKRYSLVARAFIVSTRAIPALVFALVFVRALGIGTLAGVLAIGIHSVGMVGKLFADAIEETDPGPLEAVRTTGAGHIQSFISAVVPRVVPSWVSTVLYRLDINVRNSVILGFVGAGGVGFELQARLRALHYRSSLAMIILIFVLIVLVERFSAAMRQTLLEVEGETTKLGRFTSSLASRRDSESLLPPWTRIRLVKLSWGIFALLLVLGSFWYVDLTPSELFTAIPNILGTAGRFFPPDFVTNSHLLIPALIETVAIGLAASVIGIPFAIPLAFMAARNIAPARWLYNAARYFIVAGRGVPPLVIALLFVSAVGLGPFAGTIALAIGTTFFIAKLFADAIEEISEGPREAIRTTGGSRLQESVTAVVPQIIPSFVGNSLYIVDINIRTSTILGIVGGGGIGVLLQQSLRTRSFQLAGAIILAIFIIVVVIERFSGWLRAQFI